MTVNFGKRLVFLPSAWACQTIWRYLQDGPGVVRQTCNVVSTGRAHGEAHNGRTETCALLSGQRKPDATPNRSSDTVMRKAGRLQPQAREQKTTVSHGARQIVHELRPLVLTQITASCSSHVHPLQWRPAPDSANHERIQSTFLPKGTPCECNKLS